MSRPENKNGQVLLFRAGGARFGVFIAEVGRLLVETELAPVPFAHPALAGLLDDDEEAAVPVFDLVGLLPGRRPPPQVPETRIALFVTEQGPVGMRMDAMEGGGFSYAFVSDPAEAAAWMEQLPPPLRAPVTAVAQDAGGAFYFFSADAFLAALDLAAPSRPDSVS